MRVHERGAGECKVRMHAAGKIQLQSQFFGSPAVVTVQKGDPVAFGMLNTGVPGTGDSTIFGIPYMVNAGITVFVLENDIRSAVGGAVVHHDELPAGPCLGDHGFDGGREGALRIVGGHDDADKIR